MSIESSTPLPLAGEGEARSAEGEGGFFLQTPQSFRARFRSSHNGPERMREGRKAGFARHLRRTMTDAERSLWHHLRNRSLMGYKFRRQHAIGAYIVDFVCLERRLVVELDGGQHAGNAGDESRSAMLQATGFRVLRFWDNAALADQQAVLAAILEALDGSFPAAAGSDRTRPPT